MTDDVRIWSGVLRLWWIRSQSGGGGGYTPYLSQAGLWPRSMAVAMTARSGSREKLALYSLDDPARPSADFDGKSFQFRPNVTEPALNDAAKAEVAIDAAEPLTEADRLRTQNYVLRDALRDIAAAPNPGGSGLWASGYNTARLKIVDMARSALGWPA